MILPLLLACAPFEGTWIFYLDPVGTTTGDCAEDGGNDGVEYDTNAGTLVDIYALASGGYAVMLDRALTGGAEGNVLDVEWLEEVADGSTSQASYRRMQASLEAGALSGTYAEGSWREAENGSDFTCDTSYDFTAERVVSDRDAFAGGAE